MEISEQKLRELLRREKERWLEEARDMVRGMQSRYFVKERLSTEPPADGQAPVWDATASKWRPATPTGTGAPADATYLVETANATLTNETVVGTSPGGELGGTWAAPTVDATHSGSAHHAESHTLTSHSSRAHSELTGVGATDHHSNANDHAESHDYDSHTGGVPFGDVEYDDATSDPLIDADAASDGVENSPARKDHVHPKHHAKYTDAEAVTAIEAEDPLDLAGVVDFAKYFKLEGVASPTWAAQTDDYSLGEVGLLRVTLTGNQTLTGMTGGAAGRIVVIHNIDGTDTLTVQHDNGVDSTAANRFYCDDSSNATINKNGSAIAVYDGTTSRWRLFSGGGGGGGSGDVTGPASSTDNAIARFDGTGGKTIQNSGVLVDDADNITGINSVFMDEQAAADADVAGDGQAWTKDNTPNQFVFTDDAGNDMAMGRQHISMTLVDADIHASTPKSVYHYRGAPGTQTTSNWKAYPFSYALVTSNKTLQVWRIRSGTAAQVGGNLTLTSSNRIGSASTAFALQDDDIVYILTTAGTDGEGTVIGVTLERQAA